MQNWKFYGSIFSFVLAILMIGAYYLFLSNSNTASYVLLTKADHFYDQGNYSASLPLYEEFIQKYPDDKTVYFIQKRINNIKEILVTGKNIEYIKRGQLQELLQKAITSYQKEHYLTPGNDNSMMHIEQILKLDPGNSVAKQIKQLIITNYQRKAVQAIQTRQYTKAVQNYEQILQIIPDDIVIKERLYYVISLQQQQHSSSKSKTFSQEHSRKISLRDAPKSDKMTTLESKHKKSPGEITSATLPKFSARDSNRSINSITFNKERHTQKEMISSENRSIHSSSKTGIASADKSNPATISSNKPRSPKKSQTLEGQKKDTFSHSPNHTNSPQDNSQELLASASNSNNSLISKRLENSSDDLPLPMPFKPSKLLENPPVTSNIIPKKRIISIIKEALIDGGKKKYIKKIIPKVPSSWDYGGFSVVEAKCIVDIKGKVETVKIITPSLDSRLNRLSIETLQRYQYKPATYQGRPTRFEVLESIHYTRFR